MLCIPCIINNVAENISSRDGEFILSLSKSITDFLSNFPQHSQNSKDPHLFFRCWMLPRHLKRPFTMIAMRVHNASHSSMLLREKKDTMSEFLFFLSYASESYFCFSQFVSICFLINFTLYTLSYSNSKLCKLDSYSLNVL